MQGASDSTQSYPDLRLVVTSATGKLLHEGPLMGKMQGVEVYQMPDGKRVAHIWLDGCPAYPQNQFLAYDPATAQVTDPWEKGDMCAAWSYSGDGNFVTFYRLYYPVAGVTERTWNGATFQHVKSARVLYDGVEPSRLPALLNDLAFVKTEVQGLEYIFAAPDLFDQFQERAAAGGWYLEQSGPVQGDTMTLAAKVNDKIVGTATLRLTTKDGQAVITEAVWP